MVWAAATVVGAVTVTVEAGMVYVPGDGSTVTIGVGAPWEVVAN